jgi:hypothetical protein
MYMFLISPVRATFLANVVIDLMTFIVLGEEFRL